MPRFLADEDLSYPIVLARRRLEPAIEFPTVPELGLQSAGDERLLEFAASADWLIVSHDVTTMGPAAERRVLAGRSMAGLFLIPQGRVAVRAVADDLLLIWSASAREEWAGRIVYLPL